MFVPTDVSVTTHASEMSPASNAYSMRSAPESSLRKPLILFIALPPMASWHDCHPPRTALVQRHSHIHFPFSRHPSLIMGILFISSDAPWEFVFHTSAVRCMSF